ncbi:MAG: hydrogenase nickel incorporation protein HypB [Candidatus Heimdallarchaeota archaeon]|nr:hydrogenase nickel incorporation protein HypB [Candidatus Heimdallarchaeota archaeon]
MSDDIKIVTKERNIQPKINVYDINREEAEKNKQIFEKHNIRAIDIMGSIGAGKTTILEKITEKLQGKINVMMIGGDIATTIDTKRIQKFNTNVVQINAGCHLDAKLIKKVIDDISDDELNRLQLVLIENVGNLICPAEYPLGTHMRVCVVSVTEGPYMVVKHPIIIGNADIVIINKIELAEVMEVDLDKLLSDVQKINPNARVVLTNARKGVGIDEIIAAIGIQV